VSTTPQPSLSDVYFLLAATLIRHGRNEDAARAIEQALDAEGDIREAAPFADIAEVAHQAGARDLELWASLEVALRRAETAEVMISRAAELLRPAEASGGSAVVAGWMVRSAAADLPEGARFEAALLGARAFMLAEDDERTLELLAEAAAIDGARAAAAAEHVLAPNALPPRLARDDPAAHLFRARANDALGASSAAIEEAGKVVSVLELHEHLDREIAALDLKARLLERRGADAEAAGTWLMLGQRLDLRRDHAESVAAFERATQRDPANAVAWWYLADARRLAAARTGYPYRDFDAIRHARTDWNAGLQRRAPTREESWVHCAGGLIEEALARDPEEPETLLWHALLHAEQAIALDPDHVNAQSQLVRRHRILGHPATAMVTCGHAVAAFPFDDPLARERLLTLAQLGVDDPLDALARYAQGVAAGSFPREPGADELFIDALRGYILVHVDRPDDAAASLDPLLAEDDKNVWALGYRAMARGLAGELDGARADAEKVVALTAPGRPENDATNATSRGWCALIAGDPGAAIQAFDRATGSLLSDRFEAWIGLACAHAAGDQAASADHALGQAAAAVCHRRHLVFARLAVRLAEAVAPGIDRAAVLRALEEAPASDRTFGVDAALAELAATAEAAADDDPVRWTAAVAATARILSAAGRAREAADAYDSLLARDAPLPAARERLEEALARASADAIERGDAGAAEESQRRLVELGVANDASVALAVARAFRNSGRREEALRSLQAIVAGDDVAAPDDDALHAACLAGDTLIELGHPHEAARTYEAALARIPASQPLGRAQLDVRLGVAAAAAGEPADALERFRAAIALVRPSHGRRGAAATVIDVCAEVTTPATGRFEKLRARLPRHDRVAPLQVEADWTLFPRGGDVDEASVMVEEMIPAVRERLLANTGVEIPGVRLVSSSELASGGFVIRLHDVPYAGGRVPRDASLCTAAPACEQLGIEGERFGNAWAGDDAAIWVTGDQRRAAMARGLPLLGGHEAMVWKLEGLVRLLLFRLVGITEVDHMVELWRLEQDMGDRTALPDRVLLSTRDRVRFAALVRRLVREQVPVTALGAVLSAFERSERSGASISAATESARADLASSLPGIADKRELIHLEPDVEAAVADVVVPGRALDVDEATRLLHDVGDSLLKAAPSRVALVVGDPARRPAVQTVAETLMRSAAVVSARELELGAGARGEVVAA
jgi:tetratricopeptide (TPR) repeat protein